MYEYKVTGYFKGEYFEEMFDTFDSARSRFIHLGYRENYENVEMSGIEYQNRMVG